MKTLALLGAGRRCRFLHRFERRPSASLTVIAGIGVSDLHLSVDASTKTAVEWLRADDNARRRGVREDTSPAAPGARTDAEKLAASADLTMGFVNSLELGYKTPGLTTILKLAHALGVAPADLLAEFTPSTLRRLRG